MDQNSVAVKIGFNGDLHRLRVDLNTFTLQSLVQLFARTFGLTPGSFVIKYTDADGDTLNVVSDAEFVEACRVFLSGNRDELKALKFTAVARDPAAHAVTGNPADSLIAAVEKLVSTLNTTVDKVRSEEWKGVDAATEALSQAAHDAQQTLDAARQAVQEKPFEHVLAETSDGLKTAASGISSFASRFVKTFIPEKKPEAVPNQQPTAPPAAPVVVQPEEKVEEAPAHEEEVVFTAVPEPEVVVPAVPITDAAPAVAFSDAEIKWAEQLGMIRGIFPDVQTENAIDLLEANRGDVNVVINELMESLM